MRARVYVTLKPSVFDPQGRVVADALVTLGYDDVKDVRQGKFFEVELADGDPATGMATIVVLDKGGIASDVPSRTESDPRLKGTKRRAATEREVTVTRGERDGRTIVIVPEVKDNQVTAITLLHVDFHDRLAPEVFRGVLSGYRNRYNALVDAVCETEPSFDDSRLAEIDVADILVEPVRDLARRWRGR